ncbi:hypothetical protein [Rhodococcus sp. RS1C4]|nr:hypothetical protein [Rhodococcus sp. RS1C4]
MNTAEALQQAAGIIDAEATSAHSSEFAKGMAWASFLIREYANELPECVVDRAEMVDLDVDLRDDRYGVDPKYASHMAKVNKILNYPNPYLPEERRFAPVIDMFNRRHKH